MKKIIVLLILINLWYLNACKDKYGEAKSIKIIIDPKNLSGKYSEILLSNRDSIETLIKQIKNKHREITKFFHHYSIEINYDDTTIVYWGNANFIEDMNLKTYRIVDKNWNWNY